MAQLQPVGPVTWARTSSLRGLCDHFDSVCWKDLSHPMTLEEIDAVLESGTEELPEETPPVSDDSVGTPESRLAHARRIAWFVRNGFQEPLQVDVGVPSLGCYVSWMVQDGNHRLAAAIYRRERLKEDPWLPVIVSGSVYFAKELGLMRRKPAVHRQASEKES